MIGQKGLAYFYSPGFIISDLEHMLSVPGAGNIVSWFSGGTKYNSTLLKAHYRDTLAFRDLIIATQ